MTKQVHKKKHFMKQSTDWGSNKDVYYTVCFTFVLIISESNAESWKFDPDNFDRL